MPEHSSPTEDARVLASCLLLPVSGTCCLPAAYERGQDQNCASHAAMKQYRWPQASSSGTCAQARVPGCEPSVKEGACRTDIRNLHLYLNYQEVESKTNGCVAKQLNRNLPTIICKFQGELL